ncbi:MAG: cupin domain-containing protein [bacterium]|nr:cupin domain-containing protein [bacterium]
MRPDFIRHVSKLASGKVRWPGSDEVLAVRTPLSRPLGLTRLGIHHEVLQPGHRSSLPHAEATEEECVYVLEGNPQAWIDGELHPLRPDDIVAFEPGTGIRHTITNPTDQPVRLLVIGERVAVGRKRMTRFLAWLGETHPEIGAPEDRPSEELIALANEFEGGRVRENRGLRESWHVGFIDHLRERRSDFEPD